MAKVFLPPLDSRWRLGFAWTPSPRFLDHSDNEETLWGTNWSKKYHAFVKLDPSPVGSGPEYHAWHERFTAWQTEERKKRGEPQFLKGTILQIERYHISRSGEDLITTKVLISPEPFLTPKKQGGKMSGAGRLYFSVAEFNTLPELEKFTDDFK